MSGIGISYIIVHNELFEIKFNMIPVFVLGGEAVQPNLVRSLWISKAEDAMCMCADLRR